MSSNILVFIISFIISYAIMSHYKLEPIKIIKYPTEEDIGKQIYIDEENKCYIYEKIEIM